MNKNKNIRSIRFTDEEIKQMIKLKSYYYETQHMELNTSDIVKVGIQTLYFKKIKKESNKKDY